MTVAAPPEYQPDAPVDDTLENASLDKERQLQGDDTGKTDDEAEGEDASRRSPASTSDESDENSGDEEKKMVQIPAESIEEDVGRNEKTDEKETTSSKASAKSDRESAEGSEGGRNLKTSRR